MSRFFKVLALVLLVAGLRVGEARAFFDVGSVVNAIKAAGEVLSTQAQQKLEKCISTGTGCAELCAEAPETCKTACENKIVDVIFTCNSAGEIQTATAAPVFIPPSHPGTNPGQACYFPARNYYNAERDRNRAENEFNRLLINYELSIRRKENAIMKVVGRINVVDGRITSLLIQMGYEVLSATLLNRLTCPKPTSDDYNRDFITFCNQNKAKFARLARQYAQNLGTKRGLTQRLKSTDNIHNSKVLRLFKRSLSKWAELLVRHDNENITYENLQACLGYSIAAAPRCKLTQEQINKLNSISAKTIADIWKDLEGSVVGFIGKLIPGLSGSEDPSADLDLNGSCPAAPIPPAIADTSKDGCFNFWGIGEAIGLEFCSNKLVNIITGSIE